MRWKQIEFSEMINNMNESRKPKRGMKESCDKDEYENEKNKQIYWFLYWNERERENRINEEKKKKNKSLIKFMIGSFAIYEQKFLYNIMYQLLTTLFGPIKIYTAQYKRLMDLNKEIETERRRGT